MEVLAGHKNTKSEGYTDLRNIKFSFHCIIFWFMRSWTFIV